MRYGNVVDTDPVDTAKRALTVSVELEHLILREGVEPATALIELASLYQITHGEIISWANADAEIEAWKLESPDTPISHKRYPAGHPFIGHDLSGESAETIDSVWNNTTAEDAAEVWSKIELIIGRRDAVVVIVIPS